VLQRLILYQTGLSGTLPDSVGGMTRLYDLNLHQTGLSGTLSDSVVGMTALQVFHLYHARTSVRCATAECQLCVAAGA
jgi:hypothetical protein